jgi:hypothetical protein
MRPIVNYELKVELELLTIGKKADTLQNVLDDHRLENVKLTGGIFSHINLMGHTRLT